MIAQNWRFIMNDCNCSNKKHSSSHPMVLDGTKGFEPTTKIGRPEGTKMASSTQCYCHLCREKQQLERH